MKRIRTTDSISAALALLACISLESAPRATGLVLAAALIQIGVEIVAGIS